MNTYKSNEEKDFAEWCQELKDKDIILDYSYEPYSIEVFPSAQVFKITKKGLKPKHFLRNLSYTPDFIIKWNIKNDNYKKFVTVLNTEDFTLVTNDNKTAVIYGCLKEKDMLSVIDVKGTFAGKNNNSALTFPILQKILYHNNKVFVNKIVIAKNKGLFVDTFFPKKCMYTSKGKERISKGKTFSENNYKQLKDIL